MKTMVSKRRFLAALSAAMLISAALVTSCTEPQDEYQVIKDDSTPPPVGKGLVRIKVSDSEIRTILPTLPAVTSMYFSIQFKGNNGSGNGNDYTYPEPPIGGLFYDDLNNQPIT